MILKGQLPVLPMAPPPSDVASNQTDTKSEYAPKPGLSVTSNIKHKFLRKLIEQKRQKSQDKSQEESTSSVESNSQPSTAEGVGTAAASLQVDTNYVIGRNLQIENTSILQFILVVIIQIVILRCKEIFYRA